VAHLGQRLLVHRLAPLGVALVAVLLTLPGLGAGLVGDDWFHRMVLLGRGELGARLDPTLDLFSFVPDRERPFLMDVGVLPWWCDPELRIALSRPVTALTHQLDYILWPDDFVLQHAHSLAWLALGTGLVALLYRRVHGATAVAGLAALFFAVEDGHALPAAWLANRNALVCLAAGTAVILLHLAWDRTRRPIVLVASLLTLAVALGAGEASIGALGYLAAWELTVAEKPWRARLVALLPYAAVVAAWRVLYALGHFGTRNSAIYLDPVRQPLDFLAALPERFVLLVAAQWFQAPVDVWLLFSSTGQRRLVWAAAALSACVALLARDLATRSRLARFWLLGMGLSLVPVCAAFPMERLLVFPGIGAFGALALLLEDRGVWPWPRAQGGGWRRPVAVLLLVLHLPVAALLLLVRCELVEAYGEFFSLGARLSPAAAGDQTFVYVNGNDFPVVYTYLIRVVDDPAAAPRRVALLSSALTRSRVRREDAQTLVITSGDGFLADQLDRLLARAPLTFAPGERVSRPDYDVVVRTLTEDRRPLQVAFRFRLPLEDPAYRFLQWEQGRPVSFPLPAVGEEVEVAGPLLKLKSPLGP
jgi:hypothetical protein